MTTGFITRANTASDGTQLTDESYGGHLSANGRYVGFASDADNVIANDTNDVSDIFVKDMETGEVIRASTSADGEELESFYYYEIPVPPDYPGDLVETVTRGGVLSADGRFVAFSSTASNLVPGDTDREKDVFVKDLETGAIVRPGGNNNGFQGNWSFAINVRDLSDDGRYVAYGGPMGADTAYTFVNDISADEVVYSDAYASSPTFSGDGRYLAYSDFWGSGVYIVNIETGTVVNVGPGSGPVSLSFDGRHVALQRIGIEIRDLATGQIVRADTAADGTEANGSSSKPDLSWNGRYVAFESEASNLVADDTNGVADIFLKDLETGAILRVSTADDGAEGNGASTAPVLSADGRSVAFRSDATNLVAGDTNGLRDIFFKQIDGIVPDPLLGTEGDDTITGTESDDTIGGFGGNDMIQGRGGADSLRGDGGNDTLLGDDGDDTLIGGAGYDALNGGTGNDIIEGGDANDGLYGREGNDVLKGDGGNDYLSGAWGNDTLEGGDGEDSLIGSVGNDALFGDNGDDTLLGGAGYDALNGGTGNDVLEGGDANDGLYGREGDDVLKGDGGNDYLSGAWGNDTLEGGDGEDRLFGWDGNDALFGDDGNDTLMGGAGYDALNGGTGNDVLEGGDANDGLYGREGDDVLKGDGGNDYLSGAWGNDTLEGGDGEDRVFGWDGNDDLSGGNGDDTLFGGDGIDTLNGGNGNDVFDFNALSDSGASPGADVIEDFANPGATAGDIIDVSDIATFAFVRTGPFTGGGAALRVEQQSANTHVVGDANGDTVADFEIQVNNTTAADFTADDFWLS